MTHVRKCAVDDCSNNRRERHRCGRKAIEVGDRGKCLSYECDFNYLRRLLKTQKPRAVAKEGC